MDRAPQDVEGALAEVVAPFDAHEATIKPMLAALAWAKSKTGATPAAWQRLCALAFWKHKSFPEAHDHFVHAYEKPKESKGKRKKKKMVMMMK